MVAKVSFKLQGNKKYIKKLAAFQKQATSSDVKNMWQSIGGYMLNEYHKNFRDKGKAVGGWKPISGFAAFQRKIRTATGKKKFKLPEGKTPSHVALKKYQSLTRKQQSKFEGMASRAFPLIDTGLLRDSYAVSRQGTFLKTKKNKGFISKFIGRLTGKKRGIIIGTRVKYAHFHQEGKGVPKRQMVYKPKEKDIKRMFGIIGRFYSRWRKKAKLK